MTDLQLTLAAVLVELGVPLLGLVAYMRIPRARRYAVVALGAVTPFILFYAAVGVSYGLAPSSTDVAWSFRAMWAMSFLPYAVVLGVGLVVALAPRPSNALARFCIGCSLAPLLYALTALVA